MNEQTTQPASQSTIKSALKAPILGSIINGVGLFSYSAVSVYISSNISILSFAYKAITLLPAFLLLGAVFSYISFLFPFILTKQRLIPISVGLSWLIGGLVGIFIAATSLFILKTPTDNILTYLLPALLFFSGVFNMSLYSTLNGSITKTNAHRIFLNNQA